ncbi:oxidoreductase [Philodulcilactobacillus myokoensis]|uniref:Oxidoreductase n=1 Tax=Philodulcilactobacillus myokoensis TaxID=2929573 RepID=A0A9W6B116_9LACO|nr:FAD-dependent oxidoreductase [Philodulcilactobacillus myokoensis]GLB46872.1 oxidoreductase [Philodulcilactobacillus myokoensis]
MKKIAIIGQGIIGSTTAYYLYKMFSSNIKITIFDKRRGQATKAAAGIISPWVSKRRNQQWYHLARRGADLIPKLARETHMPTDVYNQCGTIITRDTKKKLSELYQLGQKRMQEAPAMKSIQYLSSSDVKNMLPFLSKTLPGIIIKGGGKIDGAKFSNHLLKQIPEQIVNLKCGEATLVSDQQIKFQNHIEKFDNIIVAAGAWTKKTLQHINVLADIRAQKGQLIELSIHNQFKKDMPVLMPEGEYDVLPFSNGKIIIGATHEDDKTFDLKPTNNAKQKLLNSAKKIINGLDGSNVMKTKVGTRAYSSDYGPFFGIIPGHDHLLMGGALGSSGLTTGPIIGKFLAKQILSDQKLDFNYYEKPINKYFK